VLANNAFKLLRHERSSECVKMKMRQIKFDPIFLLDAVRGKAGSFAANLPSDVQLLDLKFDLCSNQVFAVIRSDSFDDIAELYPIPEFKVTYDKITEAISELTPNVKPETKTSSTTKPQLEQAKKTQVQPASRMEKEFTPEQRKLLSFKVEDERVIVKPVQFLKAEWEDINETVKSLGGKWVKGDIISYWEIPLQQA
jgi:hypothetical protein